MSKLLTKLKYQVSSNHSYFLGNCLFVFRVSEPLSPSRAERFLFFRDLEK